MLESFVIGKKNNYNQIPADSKEFLVKNVNTIKMLLSPKPFSAEKNHDSQTPAGSKLCVAFLLKNHYSQAPADSKICLVKNKNAAEMQLAPKLFSGENNPLQSNSCVLVYYLLENKSMSRGKQKR